jgi:glycolate oxidase FAD binding subunit
MSSSSSEGVPRSVRESAASFAALLDEDGVADPEGLELDGVPVAAVLRPRTAQQVADCLGAAARAGVAVVARGSGSKLHWGNQPIGKSLIVLDTRALAGPLELLPAEGIATVGAGVALAELAQRCAEIGRTTRLDGVHASATVGGTIASDALGCEFSLDRQLRGDLLGLEVALANGTLARCGGRVVKNVTGFDLVRLYCGSLGTLGVITEATLRIRPVPAQCELRMRALGDVNAALGAAQALRAARVAHAGVAVDRSGRLLWRLEGSAEELALERGRFAGEPAALEAWEEVRAERAAPVAADSAALRISARPSDTAQIAEWVQAHAGPGALRLALPAAGTVFAAVPADALETLFAEAAHGEWLLCAESAPLGFKEHGDVFGASPETRELCRAVKLRFDPESVLSPGRFVGRI